MSQQNRKILILIAVILNQICFMKSVPVENSQLTDDNELMLKNIDGDPIKSQKSAENTKQIPVLDEMNVCIDICSECFKDDMGSNDSSVIKRNLSYLSLIILNLYFFIFARL